MRRPRPLRARGVVPAAPESLVWPSLPLPPVRECWFRMGHDFSRKDRDGLVRCWYCAQLSPTSRARIEARAPEGGS